MRYTRPSGEHKREIARVLRAHYTRAELDAAYGSAYDATVNRFGCDPGINHPEVQDRVHLAHLIMYRERDLERVL